MSIQRESNPLYPRASGGAGAEGLKKGILINKDVLDLLAAKVPESEILEDYPYLEPEDIAACLEYAAEQADHPALKVG